MQMQKVRVYIGQSKGNENVDMKRDEFLTSIAREIIISDAFLPPYHNYWHFHNIPSAYSSSCNKHQPHLYVIGKNASEYLCRKLYVAANGIIFDDDKDYDDPFVLERRIWLNHTTTKNLLSTIKANNFFYYLNLLHKKPSHNNKMKTKRGWFSRVGMYYHIPHQYIIFASFWTKQGQRNYEFRFEPRTLYPFIILTTPSFSVIWLKDAIYEILQIFTGWWEYNNINNAVAQYITNAEQVGQV